MKKITSLFITEKHHGIEVKRYDDYDFLGDGVIFLDSIQTNEIDTTPTPVMAVQKMRATRIDRTPQPFRFTSDGISKYRAMGVQSNALQDKLADKLSSRKKNTDF